MPDDKEKHTPESVAVKVVRALLAAKPLAKRQPSKSKKRRNKN
jgi:hypothetical protein